MSFPDEFYMAEALRLAERGLWTTDPNPRVGCVIVKDREIVGAGWHERAGEAHAEVHALREAGERARGATCYVTLEPCCHFGRTPPCSQALIQAGVKRVVAAMQDPNPRVAGGGFGQLQQAGIEVQHGVLESAALALNPGFIRRMRDGRPFLRCKLAMSLDGRTAMASGESQWITGADARRDVQGWRARSSAIITGAGTVRHDNPSLTIRPHELPDYLPQPTQLRQPARIVIDRDLEISPAAKLLHLPGTSLIVTAQSLQHPNAASFSDTEILSLPDGRGGVDFPALLQELARREMNELWLESGAYLAGAFLQAGLIDELLIYLAPVLLGDAARGLFHLPGLNAMQDKIRLQIQEIRAVGQDWRIRAVAG